ncbi:MAG: tRNA nucleotidyltransferase [Gammaproteobacteria bacterium]|nr:tRNA nucleotidyltransferase [Gammaproteobacteria bacterium]MYC25203.1 tRNA nucleotidyltransferase [Gammaproteobacteria bacterium]
MDGDKQISREIKIPGTVYLVGGAVRDRLRNTDLDTDKDWVVVGATVEEMKVAGFTQVGAHFPVFLHPITNEEYALARIERKLGEGHRGFATDSNPSVSIEEDLERRDLTINAIAIGNDDTVIDPWGGLADIDAKILRHVSDAFVEDPLRVYRVARFTALLPDFEIAKETLALMARMRGELTTLPAERVWVEFAKAMRGLTPNRFFETLNEVGAVDPWFSDLATLSVAGLIRERWLRHANAVAAIGWLHDEDSVTKFCRRLKVPGKLFRLVRSVARHGQALCDLQEKNPSEVMRVLQLCHALRPGDAFARLVDAVEACSSTDLTTVRDLVQQLKQLRVENVSSEQYGRELQLRRLNFIETRFTG